MYHRGTDPSEMNWRVDGDLSGEGGDGVKKNVEDNGKDGEGEGEGDGEGGDQPDSFTDDDGFDWGWTDDSELGTDISSTWTGDVEPEVATDHFAMLGASKGDLVTALKYSIHHMNFLLTSKLKVGQRSAEDGGEGSTVFWQESDSCAVRRLLHALAISKRHRVVRPIAREVVAASNMGPTAGQLGSCECEYDERQPHCQITYPITAVDDEDDKHHVTCAIKAFQNLHGSSNGTAAEAAAAIRAESDIKCVNMYLYHMLSDHTTHTHQTLFATWGAMPLPAHEHPPEAIHTVSNFLLARCMLFLFTPGLMTPPPTCWSSERLVGLTP